MRLLLSKFWNYAAPLRDWRLATYVATLAVAITFASWGFAAVMSALLAVVDAHVPDTHDSAGLSRLEAHVATAAISSREDSSNRTPDPSASIAQPSRHIVPQTKITATLFADMGEAEYSGGRYRTVCVRLCDGYFFPISNAASSSSFRSDLARCEQTCGGTPVRLFVHPTSTETTEDMQDLNGMPYRRLKTAFRFRTTFDAGCKCTAHPWEQQATDRHRLYTLEAARAKGDANVVAELTALRAKIAEETRAAAASTRVANARAVAAGIANPGQSVANPYSRRVRENDDDEDYRYSRLPAGSAEPGAMHLGSTPTVRRHSGGATGSGGGSSWQSRVFSGGN